MVRAISLTTADGSLLKEFHQRVPLLQLIFIFVPLSLILKKMTRGMCPILSSPPPKLSLSFPKKGTQTQCIFIFLKCFLVSFKMYSRDQVSSPDFHIMTPSSFQKRLHLMEDDGRSGIFRLKLETVIFMFSPKEQLIRNFLTTPLKRKLEPRARHPETSVCLPNISCAGHTEKCSLLGALCSDSPSHLVALVPRSGKHLRRVLCSKLGC